MSSRRIRITTMFALMALVVSSAAVAVTFIDDGAEAEKGAATMALGGDTGYYHDYLYANYPGADPEYYQSSDLEKGMAYITWDKRELGYIMADNRWSWDNHAVVSLNTKPDGSGRSFGIDESEVVPADQVPSLADADDNIKLYMIWQEVSVSKETQKLDDQDTGLLIALGASVAIALVMLLSMIFIKKK